MLLVNNLFFILCSLPLCLNIIYYNFIGQKDYEAYSFQAYFHILAYSNNSFNFVFYYIFSKQYRQIISKLFCSVCRKTTNGKSNSNIQLKNFFSRSKLDHHRKSSTINQNQLSKSNVCTLVTNHQKNLNEIRILFKADPIESPETIQQLQIVI